MLHIHLVAIGAKMPAWVRQGYHDYARRIHGSCALHLIEVPAERRAKTAAPEQIAEREAARLLRAAPKGCRIIALDRGGRTWSTLEMARRMETWRDEGAAVALLAGGADGLAARVAAEADEVWSLSALTFAHPLLRVIVAEQIYRCFSLLEGLPYHR